MTGENVGFRAWGLVSPEPYARSATLQLQPRRVSSSPPAATGHSHSS